MVDHMPYLRRAFAFGHEPHLSSCMLLLFWLLLPAPVLAQLAVPDHAPLDMPGSYSACDAGYGLVNQACNGIEMPANAHEANWGYSRGWDCNYGYRRSNGICEEVQIPAHAFLDSTGTNWRCERGFRWNAGNSCAVVDVPSNALINSAGDGFACDRGYQRIGQDCVSIDAADHGHVADSNNGRAWTCDAGNLEEGKSCTSVTVPAYAYADNAALRKGWSCSRGYRMDGDECTLVVLPENAHLDYSGHEWVCNRPYRRQGKSCVN